MSVALDLVAGLFVVGLTVVATLFAGLVPAIRASRTNVNEILSDEARGSSSVRLGRVSKGLVIAEIAVSCGLLVAAGLMMRSVVNVTDFDFGFSTEKVFTAGVGLLEGDYPAEQDRR